MRQFSWYAPVAQLDRAARGEQVGYAITFLDRKPISHRCDSLPAGRVCMTSPMGTSQRCCLPDQVPRLASRVSIAFEICDRLLAVWETSALASPHRRHQGLGLDAQFQLHPSQHMRAPPERSANCPKSGPGRPADSPASVGDHRRRLWFRRIVSCRRDRCRSDEWRFCLRSLQPCSRRLPPGSGRIGRIARCRGDQFADFATTSGASVNRLNDA